MPPNFMSRKEEVRRTFSDGRELFVDSKYQFHCHESDTSQSSSVVELRGT